MIFYERKCSLILQIISFIYKIQIIKEPQRQNWELKTHELKKPAKLLVIC